MVKCFEELFLPPFSAHVLNSELFCFTSLYCACGLFYERAVIHHITAVLIELVFRPVNLIRESDVSLLPECTAIHDQSLARESKSRTLHLHWPFPVGCINTHRAIIANNTISSCSTLSVQLIHYTFLASLTVFDPGNIIGLTLIAIKAISTLEGQSPTGLARCTGTAILELGQRQVIGFHRKSCRNICWASPSKQGFCIFKNDEIPHVCIDVIVPQVIVELFSELAPEKKDGPVRSDGCHHGKFSPRRIFLRIWKNLVPL